MKKIVLPEPNAQSKNVETRRNGLLVRWLKFVWTILDNMSA